MSRQLGSLQDALCGAPVARITVIRRCLITCLAARLAAAGRPDGMFQQRIDMAVEPGALLTRPTEGRLSVSGEQREKVDAILRKPAFPVGSGVDEERRLLREAISARPLPADVTVTAAAQLGR